ncbi:MAG: bifunctional 2-methylcitrate synthase/citrate synthase [Thermoleophilia bacterium]|nr:bifunctional 2-methylcitrate synthase/citrate synthase [Thermoleophilia bacterium]
MTEIKKGLAGVVVDTTKVSNVVPETNSLTYRGYAVQELAANCNFEEVAYLIWNGELPSTDELAAFTETERAQRQPSKAVIDALTSLPTTCHPMDSLRTAVSIMGAEDPIAADASAEHLPSRDQLIAASMRMFAQLPAAFAWDYRRRKGLDYIAPDASLSFAENVFHQTFGEVPPAEVVKAFEISLILYAEHSFNASTFTGRVITSTLSDIYSSVTGAIGALKGPLHGGANEQVMHMMLEIDDPSKAAQWMTDALANKRKIMGFGHRVYRSGDSRVPTMKAAFLAMAERTDGAKWVEMYEELEKTMVDAKGIYPNLDFPAGPAYYLMGFEIPMFTPIFVLSRITGWTAHIIEQLESNSLIRPLSQYDGQEQRSVPVKSRA